MRSFVLKLFSIGTLVIVLLIALSMVRGVVSERQMRQGEVEANIAETSAREQTLVGPLLIVPFRQRVTEYDVDKDGRRIPVVRELDKRAVFVPETLDIDGKADTSPRKRGIYQALLYTFSGKVQAQFRIPAHLGLDVPPADVTIGRAWIAFGLSDVRGFQSNPQIRWDDTVLSPEQGTYHDALGAGVHAFVGDLNHAVAQDHKVTMSLDILGMNSLSVAPMGKATTVNLDSAWPHPSSVGRFLPRAKAEGQPYFPARWSVSHLANNAAASIVSASPEKRPTTDTFGVAFIEPVNIYIQAERAVKYGVLFVGLTFAAFYLFELLKALRIHPLQYGFVGLALTVFFLLLVSLSEHIAFVWAYAAASVACVALITYYLTHVLGGWRRGLLFGVKLSVLYGVLFGLLQSEDNALVLGAVLLFGILAAVMLLTRKVDWYSLTARGPALSSE